MSVTCRAAARVPGSRQALLDGSRWMAEIRKWLKRAGNGSDSLAKDTCPRTHLAVYCVSSFLILVARFAILEVMKVKSPATPQAPSNAYGSFNERPSRTSHRCWWSVVVDLAHGDRDRSIFDDSRFACGLPRSET